MSRPNNPSRNPPFGRGPQRIAAGAQNPNVRTISDVSEWAKLKKLSVSAADSVTLKFASDHGISVYSNPNKAKQIHPISHLARDLAVLEILKVEGRGKRFLKVLDWYGAPRNRSLTPSTPPFGVVNVNNDLNPVWISTQIGLGIDFVSAPSLNVQGDAGRWVGAPRVSLDCLSVDFDFVLIQDVYFDAVDVHRGLSGRTIELLSKYSGNKHVYVICRLFLGEAGADYGTLEEGVWFRNNDGLIFFSPDQHSAPYAAHPDVNWLQHRNHDGVDSTFLTKIGPYWLFRCTPALPRAVKLLKQISIEPEISIRTIKDSDGFARCMSRHPVLLRVAIELGLILPQQASVEIIVCNELVVTLSPIFSRRIPSGPNLDSALYKVMYEAKSIPTLEALRKRFPFVFQRIVEGTFLYVSYAQRNETAEVMDRLRCLSVTGEETIISVRAQNNPWRPALMEVQKRRITLMWVAGSVVVSFVAVCLIWWNREYLMCLFASWVESSKTLLKKDSKTSVPLAPGAFITNLGHAGYRLFCLIKEMFDDLNEFFTSPSHIAKQVNYAYGMGLDDMIVRQLEVTMSQPVTVIVSAVFEEFGKWFFPKVSMGLIILEYIISSVLLGHTSAFATLSMHLSAFVLQHLGLWGLMLALGLHTGWNFVATYYPFSTFPWGLSSRGCWRDCFGFITSWDEKSTRSLIMPPMLPGSLFDAFLRAHSEGEHLDIYGMSAVEPISANRFIPPYTSKCLVPPTDFRGTMRISVDQIGITAEQALDLLSVNPRQKNVMYPILITNGLLWEPANNEKNLLVALLWRTHLDPFVSLESEEIRHNRWKALAVDFECLPLFNGNVDELMSVQECAALMGKRGDRILKADEMDHLGLNQNLLKTISLKWNETLNVNKELGNFTTMKPRAIVNLDPIIHVRMTSYSRAIAKILHDRLDGRVFEIYGLPVRIFFAAGYNQEKLNFIGEAMQQESIVIAISGDDSVVSWGSLANILGFLQYGECDQSQFDHTQDDGPQKYAAKVWMKLLGVPDDFIDLCYDCCKRPYSVRMGRLRVSGKAGTQMPTGITMTTVLNSMSTLFMYLEVLKTRSNNLSRTASGLGFKTKYFGSSSLGDVTFLRGWWCKRPDGAGRCWMPLPSACLKLGKVLRRPSDICRYRDPITNSRVVKTDEESIRIVANALANSYVGIPLDYPVFGAFVDTLRRLGRDIPHPDMHALYESWKPVLGFHLIDRSAVLDAFTVRYGCTVEDVVRVEELFRSVRSLPSIVCDPLLQAMQERDY